MSTKFYDGKLRKEKGNKLNCKTVQESLHDEIALRDEILELKRQVMVLKRTNEQNSVKLRKYEDEAKRKDRQIEQLMDPRKNAEITKVLSTKGAAILMNLKDQNNSLVQMILNKDLQVKRLVAEIKTSKLYSSSRKTEHYRSEIFRLRNLLIKSEEMLKESMQQQTRPICINENSHSMEMSTSSEQSSPRELDELRFTIQGLETYVKHSNDLLAKKNQEILIITNELNTLRKSFQCKTCKKNSERQSLRCDLKPEIKFLREREFSFEDSQYQWGNTEKFEELIQQPLKSSGSEDFPELFEKTMKINDDRNVPNSAPTSSLRHISPSNDFTPKYCSLSNLRENTTEDWKDNAVQLTADEIFENEPHVSQDTYSNENVKKIDSKTNCTIRKSLLHDLAAGEIFKENRILSPRRNSEHTGKGKEKWKNALLLYKQFKKLNSRKTATSTLNQKETAKKSVKLEGEKKEALSDPLEKRTNKLQTRNKNIQNEQNQAAKYHEDGENEEIKDSKIIKKPKLQTKTLKKGSDKIISIDNEFNKESHGKLKNSNSISSYDEETVESSENLNASSIESISPNNEKDVQAVPNNTNCSQVPKEEERIQIKEYDLKIQAIGCSFIAEEIRLDSPKQCLSPDKNHEVLASNKSQIDSNGDTSHIKQEICSMVSTFSPEIQRELKNLYENISSYEEMEISNAKSPREIRQQSFDSSLDSENSYPIKREAQVVQVEAEINSTLIPDVSNQGRVSESIKQVESHQEDSFYGLQDGDDFDDDDDVVFR